MSPRGVVEVEFKCILLINEEAILADSFLSGEDSFEKDELRRNGRTLWDDELTSIEFTDLTFLEGDDDPRTGLLE